MTTTRGNLIALPSTRDRADKPGVDVTTLTIDEWQVIFYAAGHRRTFEEVMNGPDLNGIARMVHNAVGALGLDLIRAVAHLAEYAELNGKLPLLRQLYPNEPARMDSQSSARAVRGLLSGDMPAVQVATTIARRRAHVAPDREVA